MKDQDTLRQDLPARLVSSKALRSVAMLALDEGDSAVYMPLLRRSMEVPLLAHAWPLSEMHTATAAARHSPRRRERQEMRVEMGCSAGRHGASASWLHACSCICSQPPVLLVLGLLSAER